MEVVLGEGNEISLRSFENEALSFGNSILPLD